MKEKNLIDTVNSAFASAGMEMTIKDIKYRRNYCRIEGNLAKDYKIYGRRTSGVEAYISRETLTDVNLKTDGINFVLDVDEPKSEYLRLNACIDDFDFSEMKLPLVMGERDTDGENLVIDIAIAGHVLVVGDTHSGKTNLLKTWLTSMMINEDADDLQFVIVDLAIEDGFEDEGNLCGRLYDGQIHKSLSSLNSTIEELVRLCSSRMFLQEESSWEIGEETDSLMPDIVLVIDEAEEIKAKDEDLIKKLQFLLEKGASVGIHVILSVCSNQLSENLPENLIDSFPVRCAFEVSNLVACHDVVGDRAPSQLSFPGDMIVRWKDGSLNRVQSFYYC